MRIRFDTCSVDRSHSIACPAICDPSEATSPATAGLSSVPARCASRLADPDGTPLGRNVGRNEGQLRQLAAQLSSDGACREIDRRTARDCVGADDDLQRIDEDALRLAEYRPVAMPGPTFPYRRSEISIAPAAVGAATVPARSAVTDALPSRLDPSLHRLQGRPSSRAPPRQRGFLREARRFRSTSKRPASSDRSGLPRAPSTLPLRRRGGRARVARAPSCSLSVARPDKGSSPREDRVARRVFSIVARPVRNARPLPVERGRAFRTGCDVRECIGEQRR